MATLLLEPQDLTPAQAARVLDFLNSAASAAEIAAKVEFPGELDIGVRLGQRLLDARAALGGRYSDLSQVNAVPLIGPERFTEICAAALGLSLGARLQAGFGQIMELAGSVDKLQQRLAALEGTTGRVQLDLTASPQPAWLGQPLQIVAYVHDPHGRPLPDRQVTLEASTGTLEAAYGFAVQRARAVTVRTGADGSARLTLRAHTIEPLTADQQAALENALGQLDAGADSPNLLRTSFLSVAATYQDERQHALRAAFDIYARQWKAQFFDQINPGSLGFQWAVEMCVLRADCHPQDGGAAALTTAVLLVNWKNWVGAWFEFLGDFLTQQAKLQSAFVAAKKRGAKGYRLVDDLLGEAHSFVADQKGLAAEWLSQRVVKYAVNDFLGRELEGVDDDTQRELFSNLEGAATQLTRQSRGAIAMVNQTRVDLDDKITKVGGINAGVLEEIRGLHGEVLARASQVDTQFAAINATKADLDGRLTQFDSRFATFTTQFADFGQRYNTFTSNVSTFNQNFGKFSADYGKFNTDFGDFRTRYDDISGRLTVFDQNVAAFNQNLGKFNTDYADFRTRSDTIGGRLNTFDQNFSSFNQSLTVFNQNLTGFNQNLTGFNQNLGRFNSDLGTFQTQRTQMTQDLNTVKADLSTVKTDLSGVKRDLATTRADVAAVRTEVGTVRTDVGTVRTELGTVRTDVGTVRTDLTAVRTDVNKLNPRKPRPARKPKPTG